MNLEKLEVVDPAIDAAIKEELGRQRNKIELIASENFVSPAVMQAMGTVLTNKYAEGYPGHRYYGGCEYVDKVETLAIERAKKLFGAEHANVQPHVYMALKEVLETHPMVEAIFPMHKNPQVRKVAEEILGHLDRVHLIEPMDYEPFTNLMAKVDIVLTDSGGIQEEAPALGKPVLVLRDTTERPEAVTAGTVRLVGTNKDLVQQETIKLLEDEKYYRSMSDACNPYGDGRAAERIVKIILNNYGYPIENITEFFDKKTKK